MQSIATFFTARRASASPILKAIWMIAAFLLLAGGGAGLYKVPWRSFYSSSSSSGGDIAIVGIVGQPAAGAMSGGGYSMVGGFAVAIPAPTVPCPGDVVQNGLVDAVDLSALIAAWDTDAASYPRADVNQDGIVDGGDLGLLLASWGPCNQ